MVETRSPGSRALSGVVNVNWLGHGLEPERMTDEASLVLNIVVRIGG